MQHVPGFNLDSRRRFLETAGLGFGSVALTSLLHSEGLLGDESSTNPLADSFSLPIRRQGGDVAVPDRQPLAGRHV